MFTFIAALVLAASPSCENGQCKAPKLGSCCKAPQSAVACDCSGGGNCGRPACQCVTSDPVRPGRVRKFAPLRKLRSRGYRVGEAAVKPNPIRLAAYQVQPQPQQQPQIVINNQQPQQPQVQWAVPVVPVRPLVVPVRVLRPEIRYGLFGRAYIVYR